MILTYKKPLEVVEEHLQAHRAYLDEYYRSGNFIVSGRQNPWVGGVILCKAGSREELRHIYEHDPFYVHEVADFRVVEFEPTKYAAGFEAFIL